MIKIKQIFQDMEKIIMSLILLKKPIKIILEKKKPKKLWLKNQKNQIYEL